ncbi:protein DpdD [Pantoea sp. 18059]|uniref:protein DpdD n=1 Tax=Pantoea sp. 18059 TaxID=2681407 RepID=UPI0013301DD2|nr:protein DpdD [Pantoea sp. 18059]
MYAEWLDKFYADDKHLQYDKAIAGGYSIPQMNTLIQQAGAKALPCILPSTRRGRWVLYALAQNERSLDELRRILTAALGSADTSADISTFYDSDDAGEKILLEKSPGGVLALTFLPLPNGDKDRVDEWRKARMQRVYAMLQTVMDLYRRRPLFTSLVKRPTGRILRDFYTACHAQDGKKAEYYLEELRGNQALSPLNLLFLELLSMAASSNWDAILSHPRLEALLRGRVPERIQRLLLRSTGHFRINAIQDAQFPSDTREDARRLVLDLIPLYKVTPRFTHHASFLPDWQLWAIGAALLGIDGWQTATPLLQPEWTQQVERWVTGQSSLPLTAEVAEKALIQAPVITVLSFDDAKELLIEVITADLERESEIFAQLAAMPEITRQEIERIPKLWDIWLGLEKRCETHDYGWNHWLSDLQLATEPERFESLRQSAVMHCMDWLPTTFSSTQWQTLLGQHSHSQSGMVLRDILPNLLSWLQEYDVQVSASLWPDWLMLFVVEDIRSEEDVRLAGMILDKFLSGRFTREEYTTALEAIELVSKANISVRTLGYLLDISELLYDKVTGDDAARLGFWIKVQEMLNERWERLDDSMQFSARMVEKLYLGAHAGRAFPGQTSTSDVASPQQRDLKGKTLLIYSLMEGAARRGKDALCHLYPGLDVELNHDHVSTPALLNLVDKADYIIFATGSSKHQAFYAVTDRRRDIIYPTGKGASSMVAAFKEALE